MESHRGNGYGQATLGLDQAILCRIMPNPIGAFFNEASRLEGAVMSETKREHEYAGFSKGGVDYILIALILGLMGAFFWAIRGTGGFGGESGGMLAGLGWAALWHLFSRMDGAAGQRPYGSGRMMAAITFGIAVGGMTGYGVYIAWLQGKFYLDYPNGLRAVAPWTGYAMLFLCGLHWGGLTGAFMAWCAPQRPLDWKGWIARVGAGVCGAIAAGLIVRLFPQVFLPFYSEGLYEVAENKTCIRALGSVQNVAPHVGMFLGFLCFEGIRRDGRAVALMLVMALGFAIPFTVGGYWHTFQGSGLELPWWKNWEMSIGLGGGLAFGLAFYLFNRPEPNRPPRPVTRKECIWGTAFPLWIGCGTVFGGAYEGFRHLHEFDWPAQVRMAFTAANYLPATVLFLWWIVRTRRRTAAELAQSSATPIPAWMLVAALILIWVVGYAISIPREIHLTNAYLLTMYTVYLLSSLLLLRALWVRQARQP